MWGSSAWDVPVATLNLPRPDGIEIVCLSRPIAARPRQLPRPCESASLVATASLPAACEGHSHRIKQVLCYEPFARPRAGRVSHSESGGESWRLRPSRPKTLWPRITSVRSSIGPRRRRRPVAADADLGPAAFCIPASGSSWPRPIGTPTAPIAAASTSAGSPARPKPPTRTAPPTKA